MSLLAAINNDRYTKDGDVDLLMNRVSIAFSTSKINKGINQKEFKKLIRVGSEFDKETLWKLSLIEKHSEKTKCLKFALHPCAREITAGIFGVASIL